MLRFFPKLFQEFFNKFFQSSDIFQRSPQRIYSEINLGISLEIVGEQGRFSNEDLKVKLLAKYLISSTKKELLQGSFKSSESPEKNAKKS